MTKFNAKNERIKRDYAENLRHANGKAEQTIRQIEKSILRYEEFTDFADFAAFNQQVARRVKEHLVAMHLAPATTLSTVTALKRFFGWLAMQPGHKSKIKLSDVEFLNLTDNQVRTARAPADKPFPTLRQIERVVGLMPAGSPIDRRNRALLAFTAITGIRDGALVTLKLKHFDIDRRLVLQNPAEVATKFGKRIDTFLFPLNDIFEPIVLDWVQFLLDEQLFALHDPLFPKTALGHDENDCFKADGLSRDHWADASPARAIFKAAFESAELPAFTPHRFRDMIVSEMYARKLTIAEFKAWSQNLGHEGAMTTLTSYGKLSLEEQGRLVRESGAGKKNQPLTREDLEDILNKRGMV